MLAATSVLQQKATEIRTRRPNWQSYLQSHMISQEDFTFINQYDVADSAQSRVKILKEFQSQCARTFLSMLEHISKDETIQYILVVIDDMLQEDKSRVEIFLEYSAKKHEPVCGPFLNLLNGSDSFSMNMSARIIAKFACYSRKLINSTDMNFYLNWLKEQLFVTKATDSNDSVRMLGQPHRRQNWSVQSEGAGRKFSVSSTGTVYSHHTGDFDSSGNDYAALQDTLELKRTVTEVDPVAANNEYMQSVARCLQMLLRIDEYRLAFISVDGLSALLSVLSSRVNFQIQYQLIFCIWVLTFNPRLAERMNKFSVIPILADILSDSVKEKVTRIILAVFRNLIEKPEDISVSKEHCIAMVQVKVLKQLSILEQKKSDDEDIVEDVQFLSEKLQLSVQDLSSFDEYATEVKSGRLEWSPVHRSAQFWRENASRLNDRNYELLRILIHLLETSRDPLVLSVASYDIGEYVRHHARGKNVIEQLGGKQLVMQLLTHEDPNVRYEALLAVQKLMVHNWEYLGKQLEKDQGGSRNLTKGLASIKLTD